VTTGKRAARAREAARFYAAVLSAAEAIDLPAALKLQGIDQEIATLRLRLRKLLMERPEEMLLMLRAMDTLARMVTSKYRLPTAQEELLEVMAAVSAGIHEDVGVHRPSRENSHG
jgi:hypothetical protein